MTNRLIFKFLIFKWGNESLKMKNIINGQTCSKPTGHET